MNYYARLDESNKPFILYRATPDMKEEIWGDGSWAEAEFLLDALEGHGNIYAIDEAAAKKAFPAEAFA